MPTCVYVASVEGASGKSTLALGLLDALSRRVGRVGVFRPIVRSDANAPHGERDYVLDLLIAHDATKLTYEECTGVTYDDVHADPVAALDTIVARYHQVADQCDAVVIVGSDYTDVAAPTEFAYNARIAANLSAPVLLVLNGAGRDPAELSTVADIAAATLAEHHASLFAIVANRVASGAPGADQHTRHEEVVAALARD